MTTKIHIKISQKMIHLIVDNLIEIENELVSKVEQKNALVMELLQMLKVLEQINKELTW